MVDGALIGRRLSLYAAAWVGSFLLVLIGTLGGAAVSGWSLVDLADLVLPPLFLFLAVGTAGTLVAALLSKATLGTKLALTVLSAVLALPLLWAPVSGAVVAAALGGVSIEYSTAYAEFRIAVSRLLYPAYAALFGGELAQTAWELFQAASTVVGFAAGLVRLWPAIRRLLGGQAPGPVEID